MAKESLKKWLLKNHEDASKIVKEADNEESIESPYEKETEEELYAKPGKKLKKPEGKMKQHHGGY